MCAKHFLHCSIKKIITHNSFIFFIDFVFLISLVLPWQHCFITFFLKSSLLFEIFLVEVKKYILNTFVSFQLVSRRISRAKEKTSLKRSKALCSKYRSVHLREKKSRFSIVEGIYGFF